MAPIYSIADRSHGGSLQAWTFINFFIVCNGILTKWSLSHFEPIARLRAVSLFLENRWPGKNVSYKDACEHDRCDCERRCRSRTSPRLTVTCFAFFPTERRLAVYFKAQILFTERPSSISTRDHDHLIFSWFQLIRDFHPAGRPTPGKYLSVWYNSRCVVIEAIASELSKS